MSTPSTGRAREIGTHWVAIRDCPGEDFDGAMTTQQRTPAPHTATPSIVRVDRPGDPPTPIPEGLTRVGRSSKNDICIRESSVSRFHCCLLREGDEVRVFDSRSSNRTRVGSDEAVGQLLHDGDTLRLGRIALRFSRPAARRVATAPNRAAPPAPPAPEAAAPPPVGARGGSARRPPLASRRVASSHGSSVMPVLVILLMGGIAAGFLIYSQFSGSGGAPAPAGSDAVVDVDAVARAPSPEVEEIRRVLEEQKSQLAALREKLDSARTTTSTEAASGDANPPDDTERHLRDQIAELENARTALSARLRDALLGEPVTVVERGAGDSAPSAGEEESDWQTVVQYDAEEEEKKLDDLPRLELSTTEVNSLVDLLMSTVERYGEYGIGPKELKPELSKLSSGIGPRPVEGILRVYRHANGMLEEIDRNIAFLKKRNEKWLEQARRLAPADGEGSSTKGRVVEGSGYKSAREIEEAQRALELSAKKIEIQEVSRATLLSMRDALLGSLARFRDRGATETLAAEFALKSDLTLRLAILAALREAKARHAIPLIIPKLNNREAELADAAHKALVDLTGVDLGPERAPWDAWWRENGPPQEK